MKFRFVLLILLFLNTSLPVLSQEIVLKSFELAGNDISASTNPRVDTNEDFCALVKVRLILPDAVFEGGICGKVENKNGEYWVYMAAGSKYLQIKQTSVLPLMVNFVEYGIRSLESKRTYVLTLGVPQKNVKGYGFMIFGHDYVDLGLPSGSLWAACNVGASSPEEYGDYFAWGEIETKGLDGFKSYKFEVPEQYGLMSKYNTTDKKYKDKKKELEPIDDVAHVQWGGSWSVPSVKQFEELKNVCQWSWTTQNGVSGQLVTGPNGNSIFLPCAGYIRSDYRGIEKLEVGETGEYWSSSIDSYINQNAWHFLISEDRVKVVEGFMNRENGLVVRPVSSPIKNQKSSNLQVDALYGMIDIAYSPSGAEVWLDGTRLGTSPNLYKNIPVGDHLLEIKLSGYSTHTQSVNVKDGQSLVINGILEMNLVFATKTDSLAKGKELYEEGLKYFQMGGKDNISKGAQSFKGASRMGIAEAQCELGHCFEKRLGVEYDDLEAFKYYMMSANQGYDLGQLNVGICYFKGIGTKVNGSEALRWLRKSGEQGNMNAITNIGVLYLKGELIEKDLDQASIWLRKAAEKEYVLAQEIMEENGLSYVCRDTKNEDLSDKDWKKGFDFYLEKKYEKAIPLLKMASEKKIMMANYLLGEICQKNGNINDAKKWYRKAALMDDEEAQYELGCLYEKTHNYKLALY